MLAETIIGFDFGERRIGVAVGNRLTQSARPIDTLPAREGEPDWARVEHVLKAWKPALIVVGLPLLSDGSEQPFTERARSFADAVGARFGLPVEMISEVLSSRAAADRLRAARANGRKRRVQKGEIDAEAACLIVQTWLQEHAAS